MIGSKGDLKQGILGALTAGFMHPMKAGFNKLIAHGVTGGACLTKILLHKHLILG
jgi:hypothetical protein